MADCVRFGEVGKIVDVSGQKRVFRPHPGDFPCSDEVQSAFLRRDIGTPDEPPESFEKRVQPLGKVKGPDVGKAEVRAVRFHSGHRGKIVGVVSVRKGKHLFPQERRQLVRPDLRGVEAARARAADPLLDDPADRIVNDPLPSIGGRCPLGPGVTVIGDPGDVELPGQGAGDPEIRPGRPDAQDGRQRMLGGNGQPRPAAAGKPPPFVIGIQKKIDEREVQ